MARAINSSSDESYHSSCDVPVLGTAVFVTAHVSSRNQVLDGAFDHLGLCFEQTAQVDCLCHQVLMDHRVTLVRLHDLDDVTLYHHVTFLLNGGVGSATSAASAGGSSLFGDCNLRDQDDLHGITCVLKIDS